MVKLERRERSIIYMSTEDKIIHLSDQYANSNSLKRSVARV